MDFFGGITFGNGLMSLADMNTISISFVKFKLKHTSRKHIFTLKYNFTCIKYYFLVGFEDNPVKGLFIEAQGWSFSMANENISSLSTKYMRIIKKKI